MYAGRSFFGCGEPCIVVLRGPLGSVRLVGGEGASWLAQGSSFPQLGPHPRGPVRPAEVGVREGALTLAVPVTTTCCCGRRQQRDRGTGPGRTGLNRGLGRGDLPSGATWGVALGPIRGQDRVSPDQTGGCSGNGPTVVPLKRWRK